MRKRFLGKPGNATALGDDDVDLRRFCNHRCDPAAQGVLNQRQTTSYLLVAAVSTALDAHMSVSCEQCF